MVSVASSPAGLVRSVQKSFSTIRMRKERAAGEAGQPCVRPSFERTIDLLPSSLRTKLCVVRERNEWKAGARCGVTSMMCVRVIARSA